MGNFFKNYFSFYSPETATAVARIQIDLKNTILYYYMHSTKRYIKILKIGRVHIINFMHQDYNAIHVLAGLSYFSISNENLQLEPNGIR